jgi:peptide/nickel transport system substrate-binding protein
MATGWRGAMHQDRDTSLTRRAFLARVAALGLTGAAALMTACQEPTRPNRSSETRPAAPTLLTIPTSTPAATAKTGAQAAPPTPTPKTGGALAWAVGADADPGDLDPHTNPSLAAVRAWGDLTYQSLVMYDDRMKLVPALAEAWVNTSPTTWTFKLRQGVTFHDGSEFDAEDVRFWFERLMAPATASPHRAAFAHIAKVEPHGRYEVEFTLTGPYAPFLATFAALNGSAIAPRRWLQGAGTATTTTTVGSGPFKIAEYVPGSHITYARHAGYWEKRLPYLDTVTLSFLRAPDALVAALRGRQVHGATIGTDLLARLRSERNLTLVSAAGATQQMTIYNTRREPFDDVRVRQALALAVDRTAAITRVAGGEGQLTGPIPTGLGGWATPLDELPYRRDLPAARALLAEADHAAGFQATIRTTAEAPALLATATLLAEQLQPLGITLNIEQLTGSALAAAHRAHDFDLLTCSAGYQPDPDGYLSAIYHANGAQNASGWQNRRFDDAVNTARTVLDPGQRRALYDEASGILFDEAPHIWWFTENRLAVVQDDTPTVRGYLPAYNGRHGAFKTAWLEG